jgi:hypothetical protein
MSTPISLAYQQAIEAGRAEGNEWLRQIRAGVAAQNTLPPGAVDGMLPDITKRQPAGNLPRLPTAQSELRDRLPARGVSGKRV